MKKSLSLYLNIAISLLLLAQNSLANPSAKKQTLPVANSQATAASAAAAVVESEVIQDENIQILYKIKSHSDLAEKFKTEEKHYTISLSEGKGLHDDDVLISQRLGDSYTYSFRYCKAHDANLLNNPVDQIKELRRLHPDVFQNQETRNIFESNKVLENIFYSPACEPTSSFVYVLDIEKTHDLETRKYDGGYSGGVFFDRGCFQTALPAGIGVVAFFHAAGDYLRTNNNKNAFKRFFSAATPYKAALGAALIGLGAWRGYVMGTVIYSGNKIDTFAGATTALKNSYVVENVIPSMSQFKSNFEKGLEILIADKVIIAY